MPKGFKHGCLQVAAKSRYARMHKVSHTKPLHDATAQMTDEAVTHRPQTTTIAMDAKPTKHTQTLALRKVSGIVRMRHRQSVHMARMVVRSEGIEIA